jgi:hypothetical protein
MAKTKYEIVKAWRKRNKDKVNAQARRYHAKHPDKIAARTKRYRKRHPGLLVERVRSWEQRNPNARRQLRLASKARQEAKLVEAAGRPRPSICDLCRKNNGGIVFDHCHRTGQFRGWLCNRCNTAIGLAYESPKVLRAMARYVERSGGKAYGRKKKQASGEFFCWSGSELPN